MRTSAAAAGIDALLPYGLGGILALAILIFVFRTIFQKLLEDATAKAATSFFDQFGRARSLNRRAMRRYRRSLLENYSLHSLGFIEGATLNVLQRYVPLQYERDGQREDVGAALAESEKTVIVGAPGAGKSLLMKRILLLWATHRKGADRRAPVLVDLHRANEDGVTIEDLVYSELDRNSLRPKRTLVESGLLAGEFYLLLDGLDEVASEKQLSVAQEIKDFCARYRECKVVVTCRSAVYNGQLSPQVSTTVAVADFDDAGIRELLAFWGDELTTEEANRFFVSLANSPQLMRLAGSPLLLTMMVYLHVEVLTKTGRSLPGSRPAFYEIAVDHLLRRDRDLVRHPALSLYDGAEKKAAVQRVALKLQELPTTHADRRSIETSQLIQIVKDVLPEFNLDDDNAKPMIEEIVERSQLLVRLDKRSSRFAFRHLTLQEYLAAIELATQPDRLLEHFRREPGAWRETIKLWCGSSERDATEVIADIFGKGDLVLAVECLAEAKRVDEKFAQRVLTAALDSLRQPENRALERALGAVAADTRPRGRNLFQTLRSMVDQESEPVVVSAARALAATRLPSAAEVLSKFLGSSKEIRIALRKMGEQAIPALVTAAKSGDLLAVDDLSAIRTASAANALTSLIGDSSPVAVRAAWWLGLLIEDPAVEEGLGAESAPAWLAVAQSEATLPYSSTETLLSATEKRIVTLLRKSEVTDVPDTLTHIHGRIALAVALVESEVPSEPRNRLVLLRVRRAADVSSKLASVEDEVRPILESAARGVHPESRVRWTHLSSALYDVDLSDDRARKLAELMLRVHGVSEGRGQAFLMRPPGWIRIVAAGLLAREQPLVSVRDWEKSFVDVHRSRRFLQVLIVLFGLSAVGLHAVGGLSAFNSVSSSPLAARFWSEYLLLAILITYLGWFALLGLRQFYDRRVRSKILFLIGDKADDVLMAFDDAGPFLVPFIIFGFAASWYKSTSYLPSGWPMYLAYGILVLLLTGFWLVLVSIQRINQDLRDPIRIALNRPDKAYEDEWQMIETDARRRNARSALIRDSVTATDVSSSD